MKTLLLMYLRNYREWLVKGAPEEEPYTKTSGLCGNISRCPFVLPTDEKQVQELLTKLLPIVLIYELGEEIVSCVPFNNGNICEYLQESLLFEMHLNPKRNAWVNATIDMLEKEMLSNKPLLTELMTTLQNNPPVTPTVSYAGVICEWHGKLDIDYREYITQLRNPNLRWRCPKCGQVSEFDQDRYEELHPEEA